MKHKIERKTRPRPRPPEGDNELTLKIEKIVPGGFGLAFAENLTVFVALAAAGDRVRVKIYQRKGKTAFAEIVEIIEPSPDRTNAPCEYFGVCGGCDFQHLNYAAQLTAKVAVIKDCLTRIGRIADFGEIEIVGSPSPFGYRARAAWHLDTRNRKFGYFKRRSHDVVDVERCPILTGEMQNALTELRETIAWESFWSSTVEIEAAAAGGKVSVYSDEIIEPTSELIFEAVGEKFSYAANCFFQGNPFLIGKLIETAIGGAGGANALDLYCGVGLFTLPLARRFASVTGVEDNGQAIDFAELSAARARLANVSFQRAAVDEFLRENKISDIDFLLLDPPRAGAEKNVLEKILQIRPAQISYVSCEPSVLARDLRLLIDGDYKIEKIIALDLFPQTHHVETIVRLKRTAIKGKIEIAKDDLSTNKF